VTISEPSKGESDKKEWFFNRWRKRLSNAIKSLFQKMKRDMKDNKPMTDKKDDHPPESG